MAGPSIVVRVLGDVTGMAKSFGQAATAAAGSAGKLRDAFGGVLSTLNATGVLGPFGEALAGVDQALGQIAEHGKEVGGAMIGVGGALAGIGVGLAALGSSDQAAHQQLQQAIANTGHSYDDYADQIDQAIKHQEKFGDSSAQTQNALQALTQATGDPAKALQYLSLASDLAAAKHESLQEAATQVGKAYNGQGKALKDFGVQISAKSTQQQRDAALTLLAAKVHGQAGAAADTFSGHIASLKAHLEDTAASLGQKYGPAITAAGTAMAGLGAVVTTGQAVMGLFKGATEAATGATEAMAGAEDAAAVSEGLALAPILLIVGALAVLGLAAYEIYTHWTTIWRDIKGAVVDVWDWIKSNWPLLLAILTGPIGLAVLEIVRHWHDILAAVQAVWGWIKSTWNTVYHFVVDPVAQAVGAVVGFFERLPGQLAGFFVHMWDGIYDAFRAVINAVIDIWNDLHFTLPKVSILGVHIGGETIGVPHIPHLAQGGLITQTGLVFAHAGEAITPIDKVPRGPAVHIDHAHFDSEVDVDLFMRRVAWTVQTQRI